MEVNCEVTRSYDGRLGNCPPPRKQRPSEKDPLWAIGYTCKCNSPYSSETQNGLTSQGTTQTGVAT